MSDISRRSPASMLASLAQSVLNKIRIVGNSLVRSIRRTKTPKGDKYYGREAQEYVSKRLQNEKWYREQRGMEMLLTKLPDSISVLDVPFGTGRFVPFYLKKNMEVYGLDSSQDMIDAAHDDLGLDFDSVSIRVADARNLPYDDASFDLVVCFRFLAGIINFGDAKQVISEISRVCRRHAILELKIRDDSASRKRYPKDTELMGKLLYRPELETLLQERGFVIADASEPFKKSEVHTQYAFLCEKTGRN